MAKELCLEKTAAFKKANGLMVSIRETKKMRKSKNGNGIKSYLFTTMRKLNYSKKNLKTS